MPRNRWLSLLGLVTVLALSVGLVVACGPKQVAVPNVVGSSAAEASVVLTAAKLTVGTPTLEYSDSVASGTVISQAPPAASQVPEGSPVDLVVSKGVTPVAVPDVKGMDSAAAQTAMTTAGLSMVSYDEYDPTIAVGQSVGQLPPAGFEVAPGSEVIVGFSLGVAPTDGTVPGVLGATKASALSKLGKAGFKVSSSSAHVVGVKSGIVVAQVPAQGAKAGPGSHVIIMVASGSPVGTIPSASGMQRTQANNAVADAGFSAKVYQMASAQVAKGKAFAQLAVAGAEELHGSVNAIVMSLGPLTTTGTPVPTVTGQAQAAATQAIKTAGFVPVVVAVHDPSVPLGAVIAQVPAAGASAKMGQQMLISVSQGPIQLAEAKIPAVTKMSTAAAESALKKAGLASSLGHLYSPTAAKGSVMGQLPAAGATVLKGATVEIVISLGKEPPLDITMPDLKGMTEEAAMAEVKNLGLVAVNVPGSASASPLATVLQQFPAAGATLNAGSYVALVVAH